MRQLPWVLIPAIALMLFGCSSDPPPPRSTSNAAPQAGESGGDSSGSSLTVTRGGSNSAQSNNQQPQRASASVTGLEQYHVELINRMRRDPIADVDRCGIDLPPAERSAIASQGALQPLAVVMPLNEAGQGHAASMMNEGYFAHEGSDGSTIHSRIRAAGWRAAGGWAVGENLHVRSSSDRAKVTGAPIMREHHCSLLGSPTHRENLVKPRFSEIGVARVFGPYSSYGQSFPYTSMLAQEFADGGRSYLLGVVYRDANFNGAFDLGEGIANAAIVAEADGSGFTTRSRSAGGYSLVLPPGLYTVRIGLPGQGDIVSQLIEIGEDNRQLDARL